MRRLVERGVGEFVTTSADLALDVGLARLIARRSETKMLKNPLILKVGKNQWDRRGARARGRGESALGRRDFRPNGRVLYGAARPSRQRCRNGRRADRIRLVSRAIRRSHVFVPRVKNEGMNEMVTVQSAVFQDIAPIVTKNAKAAVTSDSYGVS